LYDNGLDSSGRATSFDHPINPLQALLLVSFDCIGASPNISEPVRINFRPFDHLGLYTQMEIFEFVRELVSIHQVDGRGPISRGFPHGIPCKCSPCNEKAFIGPADECAPEVPDGAG
jgi:hypothetical protein